MKIARQTRSKKNIQSDVISCSVQKMRVIFYHAGTRYMGVGSTRISISFFSSSSLNFLRTYLLLRKRERVCLVSYLHHQSLSGARRTAYFNLKSNLPNDYAHNFRPEFRIKCTHSVFPRTRREGGHVSGGEKGLALLFRGTKLNFCARVR